MNSVSSSNLTTTTLLENEQEVNVCENYISPIYVFVGSLLVSIVGFLIYVLVFA